MANRPLEVVPPETSDPPAKKKQTITPEHQAKMKAARIASGNLGGRKKKPTSTEARDLALSRLEPKAIKVLEAQLEDPDPRVRQAAAIKLLEYRWGKPTQTVAMDKERPMRVIYESAFVIPDMIPVEEMPDGDK